jgi:hypothetical protein
MYFFFVQTRAHSVFSPIQCCVSFVFVIHRGKQQFSDKRRSVLMSNESPTIFFTLHNLRRSLLYDFALMIKKNYLTRFAYGQLQLVQASILHIFVASLYLLNVVETASKHVIMILLNR